MRRVFKPLVIVFSCTLCISLHSQNSIHGLVNDSIGKPVPFCAMGLLKASDSSLVKGNITNDLGEYVFEKIEPGRYLIQFNSVGYKPAWSKVFSLDSLSKLELGPQILKSEGVNLNEIAVSTFKPVVEFKKGAIVLNVENNISSGGNTIFQLLKRLPGVSIDSQNNITINGKGGVRFLMDGRLQQIPASQMINLLMSMPAESVSTIELILNPPARYDAAGTGGLINIVFKKAKVKGFNGNIGQSTSKGDNWRGGTFTTLNYKADKLSLFSNLGLNYLKFKTDNYFDRKVTDSSGTFEIISQGNQQPFRKMLNFNGGLEYAFTSKTILGMNFITNNGSTPNKEITQINVVTPGYVNYNMIRFENDTKSDIANPSVNMNLQHKFDSVTNIQFSADYTNYFEHYTRFNSSHYYDNSNADIVPVNHFGSDITNNFNIYTQRLDFDRQFKKGFSIETGAKNSYVDNRSNSTIFLTDTLSGDLYVDSNFSNNYRYKEQIIAAYATLGKEFKKLDVRAGIRSEKTLINASIAEKTFILHRDYINFFPSSSIDYKVNAKNSVQANYSYRIGRPRYDQLNPSRVFNDPFSNGAGNPYLKPEYSHNVNLNYIYNGFISMNAAYTQSRNNLYFYAYGDPNTKATVDSVFNFQKMRNLSLNLSVQKQVKWYSFQVYAGFIYRESATIVNDLPVSLNSYLYYGYMNNEFMLPKDIKLQIQANYNSRSTDGIQEYLPNGRVDITIFRSFFDKKLDLSLSLFDAFYTDIRPYINEVGGQHSYYKERNDTRRFRIWVMWKFGKMKINRSINRKNDDNGRLKGV